ncbi:MAG: hypothetical protein ACLFTT_13015 [Candidatus Hydrogenedentota bacterium]
MELIVDDKRNFEFEGNPEDVFSALAAIDKHLQEQGRAMLEVKVNGETLAPDDLLARLESTAIENVHTLEVRSSDLAELVANSLTDLEAALPDLPEACRMLAELFHGESPDQGFGAFNELARIWSHVKAQQARITALLQLDMAQLTVGDKPADQFHEELNQFLEEAATAIESGDCVLLGDLLEYELAPRAEQETELVNKLKGEATAALGQ